jgi:hypothetical protein
MKTLSFEKRLSIQKNNDEKSEVFVARTGNLTMRFVPSAPRNKVHFSLLHPPTHTQTEIAFPNKYFSQFVFFMLTQLNG